MTRWIMVKQHTCRNYSFTHQKKKKDYRTVSMMQRDTWNYTWRRYFNVLNDYIMSIKFDKSYLYDWESKRFCGTFKAIKSELISAQLFFYLYREALLSKQ